jgi:nicotinamidase-related amidase
MTTEPIPEPTAAADPLASSALVVVDVQEGFADPAWGTRNNPAFEGNLQQLLEAWTAAGLPLVYVRHDSSEAHSPLYPNQPGNELQELLATASPDLLVTKQVNSSFHGSPDLHGWLRGNGLTGIVVTGITTNHCCETTARVGGNLGYDVRFVLDSTYTFDRTGPDGTTMTADELARATATNLHGEFATVVSTADLLALLRG